MFFTVGADTPAFTVAVAESNTLATQHLSPVLDDETMVRLTTVLDCVFHEQQPKSPR
jgi:hypothetical protein